ncbi:hypothetical protein GCM10025774_36710 [Microbacterium kyungheense]
MSTRHVRRTALTLSIITVTVVAILLVVVASAQLVDEGASAMQVSGTWASSSSEAPGTIAIETDGTAAASGLTVLDQRADPARVLGTGIEGTGSWTLDRGQLKVVIADEAGTEYELHMFVMRTPLRGQFLRVVVGDPDGPRATQDFWRAD